MSSISLIDRRRERVVYMFRMNIYIHNTCELNDDDDSLNVCKCTVTIEYFLEYIIFKRNNILLHTSTDGKDKRYDETGKSNCDNCANR